MHSNKPTEVDSMNRLRVQAENRAAELKEENDKFHAAFADLLSVRDQFAKAALQPVMQMIVDGKHEPSIDQLPISSEDFIAVSAYRIADAMMKARAHVSGVAVPEAPSGALVLDRYDAGLLGGMEGMSAEWWQDYIRAELARAHDFYQQQADNFTAGVESRKP